MVTYVLGVNPDRGLDNLAAERLAVRADGAASALPVKPTWKVRVACSNAQNIPIRIIKFPDRFATPL